jgi:D-beta-D-heptose 7-phosphate kinase/D-beta-D-heptose 1-phosphate adenosyltransferase
VLLGARASTALIVGINSDESVRRLKGPTRPVRSAAERAYVLAGLESVDAVVVFEQDTPAELVSVLQPDVIVKGGDYRPDTIVGAADVIARGGRVVDSAHGRSIHNVHHREASWLILQQVLQVPARRR